MEDMCCRTRVIGETRESSKILKLDALLEDVISTDSMRKTYPPKGRSFHDRERDLLLCMVIKFGWPSSISLHPPLWDSSQALKASLQISDEFVRGFLPVFISPRTHSPK